jgi:hypothetical protein
VDVTDGPAATKPTPAAISAMPSHRAGEKHIGKVGPRKGGHVAGKKRKQQKDSRSHPRIEDRQQQAGQVVQGNAAKIFHALSQQGITRCAEYGNSRQDEVFSVCHS